MASAAAKDGKDDSSDQRVSKAQKRRDKKAQKERERLEDIERQDELNQHGARQLEMDAIKERLAKRNLVVHIVSIQ